jgi:hypothetical protein
VGLPVATGYLINISQRFIDKEGGLWFQVSAGALPPSPGLQFGSLLLGDPSGPNRPNEYISPSRVGSIRNRDMFLGMYILDVWANHQDNRQGILLRRADGFGQDISFIDHGHMFGGPSWLFRERPGIACHLERSVYEGLWNQKSKSYWVSRFETTIPDAIIWAARNVPIEWYKGDVEQLLTTLLCRLARLAELLESDFLGCRDRIGRDIEVHCDEIFNFGVRSLRASTSGMAAPAAPLD